MLFALHPSSDVLSSRDVALALQVSRIMAVINERRICLRPNIAQTRVRLQKLCHLSAFSGGLGHRRHEPVAFANIEELLSRSVCWWRRDTGRRDARSHLIARKVRAGHRILSQTIVLVYTVSVARGSSSRSSNSSWSKRCPKELIQSAQPSGTPTCNCGRSLPDRGCRCGMNLQSSPT